MQELSNPKHETFARAVAVGHSLTEAARRAGYSEGGIGNAASRLAKQRTVAQRIAHIRSTVDNKQLASRDWILVEAIDNHLQAKKNGDINTSRQCLEFIARLQGYLTEKRVTESYKVSLDLRDPKALKEAIREQLAGLPEDKRGPLMLEAPADLASEIVVEAKAEEVKQEKTQYVSD